jgi:hypothetical protein
VKCLFCDRPATKFCDYILGMKGMQIEELIKLRPGQDPQINHRMVFDTSDVESYTCDAPLCDMHAVRGETTFYCGSGGCDIETEDFCPTHPRQDHGACKPMFLWDANRARMAERLKVRLQVERRQSARWLE